MFFRVLGPLDVSLRGTSVKVGKNRQRTVLAALLAEANRAVSVGWLVEVVWNGNPPRTAAEQIQTCIWRLRRMFVLAGAPRDPIETTPSGYALRVDPDDVDATLFERLAREARSIASEGGSALAAARYREALQLFRGPVLAEISSPLLQSVSASWEERRLTALEECFDLELSSEMSAELVDELTTLVWLHPLRERFRAQLMRALRDSDRRAEALAAYQDCRNKMVSELGLEPSSTLQELHHGILADEPVRTDAVPSRVPALLPADITDFVGRQDQITEFTRLLTGSGSPVAPESDNARMFTLLGSRGAGKTALAVHTAHRVRDHFPGGQLYADLGDIPADLARTAEILRGFLRALGVPTAEIPEDTHACASLYRSLVAERRMLVVLDDAVNSDQIERLLPSGPRTAVIITTRSNLTDLPGSVPVEVEAFSEQEALTLLGRIIGSGRVEAELGSARQIVAAAGRLPLAVRAAGARLVGRPNVSLAHFAQRLGHPFRRLDMFSYGTLDLRARLSVNTHALPAEPRMLWCALGLVGMSDFDTRPAAQLADCAPSHAERLLDQLVDQRLVDIAGIDDEAHIHYHMHELVGLYAKERAHTELPEPVRTRVSNVAVNGFPDDWRTTVHSGV
ncbi:AfsR/SARP family transcriptional regulator [Actinopolyspora erythraea]|nr:AfsR/SARP family transcriptional regulator [Actinopolyspora erythraea]